MALSGPVRMSYRIYNTHTSGFLYADTESERMCWAPWYGSKQSLPRNYFSYLWDVGSGPGNKPCVHSKASVSSFSPPILLRSDTFDLEFAHRPDDSRIWWEGDGRFFFCMSARWSRPGSFGELGVSWCFAWRSSDSSEGKPRFAGLGGVSHFQEYSSGTGSWIGGIAGRDDPLSIAIQSTFYSRLQSMFFWGNWKKHDWIKNGQPIPIHLWREIFDNAVQIAWDQWLHKTTNGYWLPGSVSDTFSYEALDMSKFTRILPDPSFVKQAFLFDELSIADFGKPWSPGSLSNYWVDLLRTRAFVDACDAMPRLSDNSISNAQNCLEFLLSIVRREPPKLPTDLRDAWLGYRYEYNTTKMDIEEALNFVDRYINLGGLSDWVETHGKFSMDYKNTKVTCKCSFKVRPRPLPWHDFKRAWRDLSTLGLVPDLYYLWDSTPFSFIVDWFVPVGDVLAAADASLLYTGSNYEFSDICYSLSYAVDAEPYPVRCYSRWVENSSPVINPFYWFEKVNEPSNKQVLYRVLDSVSLFTGRN